MARSQASQTQRPKRRGWRVFLTTFKWCRVAVLALLLAAVIFGIFLSDVGMPEWIERRVERQFREMGWDISFGRLRLHWYRGVVAEDLELKRSNHPSTPHLFLNTAEFRLNWKALKHLDLEADSVLLKDGQLQWPLTETNKPTRIVTLGRIGGELLLKPGDLWELKFLEADLMGMHLHFRGDITNASLIREWRLPSRPRPPGAPKPEEFWYRLLSRLENVRFQGRPELNAVFSGDARDWRSFDTKTKFTAHAADTPWLSGTNISVLVHLLAPAKTNSPLRAECKFTGDQLKSQWGQARALNVSLVLEPSLTQFWPTNALMLAEAQGFQGPQGKADRISVELRTAPSITNSALNQTRVDVTADSLKTSLGMASRARLIATGLHPAPSPLPATVETSLNLDNTETLWATSRWTQISSVLDLPSLGALQSPQINSNWLDRITAATPLSLNLAASDLAGGGLRFDRAEAKTRWKSPELNISLEGHLRQGAARLEATLQSETREVRFHTTTSLEPASIAPLFWTNTPNWMSSVTFEQAPRLEAKGRLIVPKPTNSSPPQIGDVLPSLELAGELRSAAGAYQDISFQVAHVPFTLTNLMWESMGAEIIRADGSIGLSGAFNQSNGDYRAAIQSRFNPLSLRPAFPHPKAQLIFDWFQLSGPPRVDVSLSGKVGDFSRFTATADVVLTNAVFREQPISLCTAKVIYTNRFLSILDPLVLREGERGRADGIGINLERPRLYLTNAIGNISARAVTKAIGPGVDRDIAPFIFDLPPAARVQGSVPLGKSDKTEDMRFEVDGGPFHWEVFHLEQVRASLWWRGDTLAVTNLQGRWRGAKVSGSGLFDFTPGGTSPFSFRVRVDGGDLRKVLRDLQPARTNRVEGDVSGELVITHAQIRDPNSWQGFGHAQLTNGLLWEIPLFGVFSPMLNAVFPGLGSSRAKHAGATFYITNSVIHSDDMEIRATAMRMRYKGSVDFGRTVEGRMEAELLRDVPAFGFVISKIFWPVTKLFEYEITGTLDNPKTEQKYFASKLLILPFQPIKTMKEIWNSLEANQTQPPPQNAEP